MLMTALVAIFGISGTAVAAKRLVTGADIKNGSITGVDLSKSTQDALRGKRGAAGVTGARGFKGVGGARGAKGSKGSKGVGGVAGSDGRTGRPERMGRPERTAARVRWAGRVSGSQRTQGSTGATGGQGAPGTTGLQGIPAVRYFAAISAAGVVTRASGILSASGTNGVFDVTTLATDLSACVATAQAGLDVDLVPGSAVDNREEPPFGSGHVTVKTWDSKIAATNESFVLTISC